MGRSEPTPQRFRRKARGRDSSSAASQQIPNPVSSPPDNCMSSLLINSPLDSDVHSEPSGEDPQGSAAVNGTCPAAGELTDRPPQQEPGEPPDLSSFLPADCSGLPRSDIRPLCSHQTLCLSACHVQKEDSVVLLVFITNSSDADLQHVLLRFDSDELEVNRSIRNTSVSRSVPFHIKGKFGPMCLQVSQVSDPPAEEMRAHGVEVCQYSLVVKRPSAHVQVVGMVSFCTPVETPQTAQFSYKLPLTAFIR